MRAFFRSGRRQCEHVFVSAVRVVRTREAVAALLAEKVPLAEIARRLGISKSTVSYHARRLGAPRDERGARRYDWAAIQAHYDRGHTVAECCEAFGFSTQTWSAAVRRGAVVARSRTIPSTSSCGPASPTSDSSSSAG